MGITKLGWVNLQRIEKAMLIMATLVSIGLSANDMIYGGASWSNSSVLGPLVLMALVIQSTFMVGLIRGRSMAMNGMFVELMKELADARKRLGENNEVPPNMKEMVAKYLGDK